MDVRYLMVLLLIYANCHSSASIYCFTCSSFDKAACGDDFRITTSDALSRSWCDGSCVKRRGERVSGSVRRIEIIRSCVTRQSEGCYKETFNALDMYTCSCNTDFCNSSSKVTYSASFVISVLLLVILLYI